MCDFDFIKNKKEEEERYTSTWSIWYKMCCTDELISDKFDRVEGWFKGRKDSGEIILFDLIGSVDLMKSNFIFEFVLDLLIEKICEILLTGFVVGSDKYIQLVELFKV